LSLSVCMIMKNEEKFLARCLNSVKGVADEIVIVDTGSSDRSVDIARGFTDRIFHMAWMDDFSGPRNSSISHASGDWIFVIDPDEVFSAKDLPLLKKCMEHPVTVAYQVDTRNYTNASQLLGWELNDGRYPEGARWRGFVASAKVRLFKNGLGLKFRGIVHEMVDYEVEERKLPGDKAAFSIVHFMEDTTQWGLHRKRQFHLRLCERKVELDRSDGQAWWELGIAQYLLGLYAQAIFSVKRGLELGIKKPDRYFTLGMIYKAMGRWDIGHYWYEKGICLTFPDLTHRERVK